MKQKYYSEIEGMRDFYHDLGVTADYVCGTDGVVGGTLFEFKLDENRHDLVYKKQCKRYIAAYNAKALDIPSRTIIVTLNTREYTVYNNRTGRVLRKKSVFGSPREVGESIAYSFMDGWIDEDGYALIAYNDRFYANSKGQDKELFIQELMSPNVLPVEPYDLRGNSGLCAELLDCLGGKELKKRLGAFFTPDEYVKISTDYVREAIRRVPKGNDYVIIDRFAGTGALEKFLTEEELSHCILNTYVFSEWLTLKGVYDGRVRYVVPHTSKSRNEDGTLEEGNAFSERFISDQKIRQYVDDPKCTVIMLENPPYGEPQAEASRGGKTFTSKECPIAKQMKDEKRYGIASRDLVNRAIWSMTKYYSPDFVVLFAPWKSWKVQGFLSDYHCDKAYVANRKHFHATEGAIGLGLWLKGDKDQTVIKAECDIVGKEVNVRKIMTGCVVNNSHVAPPDGDVIALLTTSSFEPIFLNGGLGNTDYYRKLGGSPAKELAKNNCLEALPLWVANCYEYQDYTERGVIGKTSDGGMRYRKDKRFLQDCLFWTCLTNKNKCVSDGRVRNELCLSQGTAADELLDKLQKDHVKILDVWDTILLMLKSTDEYDASYTYGLYQIGKDIDLKVDTDSLTKTGKPIKTYKYPELNAKIGELKELLSAFFKTRIRDKLFEYELLK